jgi:spore germination protein YaaH
MPSKVFHDTWHLANLGIFIKYRVKDGDSIKSIAQSVGLTWQELARFNWGTDVPNEINWYLKNYFVCTHKTADGNNYLFTSQDEPGIIVLPKPQLLAPAGQLRGVFPISRFLPR